MKPLTQVPGLDAPISEWCRPLSAVCGGLRDPSEGKGYVFSPGALHARLVDARRKGGMERAKQIRASERGRGWCGGRNRLFNDEQAAKLLRDYRRGQTVEDLAERYGCALGTIRRALDLAMARERADG